MSNFTLDVMFNERLTTPSDINEHMGMLRALATQCQHITEFGVRTGNSTVAFLAGLTPHNGELVSYDLNQPVQLQQELEHRGLGSLLSNRRWQFMQADTSRLDIIQPTDMLFIDTLHTMYQVDRELEHAASVRRYIVLHDVVLFAFEDENPARPGNQAPRGEHDKDATRGIMSSVLRFLGYARNWRVRNFYYHNNGLLVLERRHE